MLSLAQASWEFEAPCVVRDPGGATRSLTLTSPSLLASLLQPARRERTQREAARKLGFSVLR